MTATTAAPRSADTAAPGTRTDPSTTRLLHLLRAQRASLHCAPPVVLAVDPSRTDVLSPTVGRAVDEALARRAGLFIVSAVPGDGEPRTQSTSFAAACRAMVQAAGKAAREHLPASRVSEHVLRTGAVDSLVAMSAEAGVLITAQPEHGQAIGRGGDSTALCVAARACCPVILTHPTVPDPATDGDIVVGVHPDGLATAALRFAITQASRTGRSVRAVLAIPPGIFDLSATGRPPEFASRWLLRHVTTERSHLPAADVRTRVVIGDVVDTLIAMSGKQHSLVIGHRGHAHLPRVGGDRVLQRTASAARCDVVVVPVGDGTAP